ncbi:MAG: hypothetical protein QXV86_00095 [Candidatus Caldarchaeum sp.]
MRILALAVVLIMMFIPTQSTPAYGLLRTYGENTFESAYDIEADSGGIYLVGSFNSPNWRTPQPSLTILNPDHTHRCSTRLEFVVDLSFVLGSSMAVEANRTHVFVAGFYWTDRLGEIAVFVAAFTKTGCRMTGLHTLHVTNFEEITITSLLSGEGIDLAVDETGIYLLVGYFIYADGGSDLGFLVLKLDQYLQPETYDFYDITDTRDYGVSIALGGENIYVAGLTNFQIQQGFSGEYVFVLELAKSDLSVKNVTLLQPINEHSLGLEIVVDENNDVYVVQTYQKRTVSNVVVVSKFDRRMNVVWWNAYQLQYTYMDSSLSPPEHIPVSYAYAVSAAVSPTYLFVGGFTPSTSGFLNGLFLAIDRGNGEGILAFRVQADQGPSQNVQVFGVDAYDDCAFLAGVSENYRLEYVFLNNFDSSLTPLTRPEDARPLGGKYVVREDRPEIYEPRPFFDEDTGADSYAFYGVFCPGSMIVSTTTTSTSITTSTTTTTTTSTSTTTSTATTTTTSTSITTSTATLRRTTTTTSTVLVTSTDYVVDIIYSTRYTTQSRYSTTTLSETITLTRTLETTHTHSTTLSNIIQVLTTSTVTPPAMLSTTTLYLNTTRTVVITTQKAGQVDWVLPPPWLYLPALLLPIPLAAVLLSGRRNRIVINKSTIPPYNWTEGQPPIVDDLYMKPSVLSIKKNTKVEFVNKDDTPHVLMAYDGPAEYLFKSQEIKPGQRMKHKFVEPGVYYIKSLTKPYMGAVIRVG